LPLVCYLYIAYYGRSGHRLVPDAVFRPGQVLQG